MISKINKHNSSKNALAYDLNKKGAELIFRQNLFAENQEGMAAELEAITNTKNLKNPFWHVSLSLPEGEKGTQEQWQMASLAYLKKMGFDVEKTAFTVARHSDTPHDHIHILVSRIQLDGKLISDKFERKRSHEATAYASKIAKFPSLQSQQKKEEGKFFDLKQTITHTLKSAKNYDEFKESLKNQGVLIIENKSQTTGRVAGISYQLDAGKIFKGSEISKSFGYNQIQKHFENEDEANKTSTASHPAPAMGGAISTKDLIAGMKIENGRLNGSQKSAVEARKRLMNLQK